MDETKLATGSITFTHDRRPVYAAGSALPEHASGWTQCDNRGGGYAVWLADEDIAASKADYAAIQAEAKTLRTHKACEAALRSLSLESRGSCADMRLTFQITKYADLWPLRQVA
jgi:hypothetical protein